MQLTNAQLLKEIKELYNKGYSPSRFRREVLKLFRKYNYYHRDDILFSALNNMGYETGTKRTSTNLLLPAVLGGLVVAGSLLFPATQYVLKQSLKTEYRNFKTAETTFVFDISRDYRQAYQAQESFTDFKAKLDKDFRKYNNTIKTLDNTFAHGLQNIKNVNSALEKGYDKFIYTGPPPERLFCEHIIGFVFTLEQILVMDNGQGLPVLSNGGGYNCRHWWEAL